jgi:hypothetical protein
LRGKRVPDRALQGETRLPEPAKSKGALKN